MAYDGVMLGSAGCRRNQTSPARLLQAGVQWAAAALQTCLIHQKLHDKHRRCFVISTCDASHTTALSPITLCGPDVALLGLRCGAQLDGYVWNKTTIAFEQHIHRTKM